MTTPALGYDSEFAVESAAGSATYTALAKVRNITPPNASIDDVDVTHMKSPDRAREFIAGLTDYGDCEVELLFEAGSTTDDFIEAWRAGGETRSCKITFPNAATWTFSAYPKGYAPELPMDDVQTAVLTMKVASSITRA